MPLMKRSAHCNNHNRYKHNAWSEFSGEAFLFGLRAQNRELRWRDRNLFPAVSPSSRKFRMQRILRLLYATVRRLKIIDVTQLLHLHPGSELSAKCPEGYTVRAVHQAELSDLIAANRVDPSVGNADSLNNRHRSLVAVFHADQIVSFLWLANEAVDSRDNYSRSEHLGTSIGMPDGTVFVYNAWTSPEHRGKRLVAAMLGWALRNRIGGALACLTMIDWTNHRSIRAFEFLGMKRLGWIIRFGRGRLQFSLIPSKAKHLGVQVATSAPGFKLAW